MAERVQRGYDLPHDPLALLGVLRSAEAVRERSAAGVGSRVIEHDVRDGSVLIVTESDIPLDWLPGAVRDRLGSSPTVERTEEWAASADGAASPLTFRFSGLPVACDGSARLTASGTGSRLEYDLTVRVDVPFLGGTIERAVVPQVSDALDAEAAFYQTWGGTVRP